MITITETAITSQPLKKVRELLFPEQFYRVAPVIINTKMIESRPPTYTQTFALGNKRFTYTINEVAINDSPDYFEIIYSCNFKDRIKIVAGIELTSVENSTKIALASEITQIDDSIITKGMLKANRTLILKKVRTVLNDLEIYLEK